MAEQREAATATAERIRNDWIDLTFALPDPSPPKILRLWNEADNAMRQLIIALGEPR